MALDIFWTAFAENELFKIFEHYRDRASIKVAQKLTISIVKKTEILSGHPQTGQIEELLLDKEMEFRFWVCKQFKIIYSINTIKNRIEIHDVFDCR